MIAKSATVRSRKPFPGKHIHFLFTPDRAADEPRSRAKTVLQKPAFFPNLPNPAHKPAGRYSKSAKQSKHTTVGLGCLFKPTYCKIEVALSSAEPSPNPAPQA